MKNFQRRFVPNEPLLFILFAVVSYWVVGHRTTCHAACQFAVQNSYTANHKLSASAGGWSVDNNVIFLQRYYHNRGLSSRPILHSITLRLLSLCAYLPLCTCLHSGCRLPLRTPYFRTHLPHPFLLSLPFLSSHVPHAASPLFCSIYLQGLSTMSDNGIVSVGTAKMIGFILAICGNTLIACSLTLQKSAHNTVSSTFSDDNDDLNDFNTDSSDLDGPMTRAEVLNAPDLDPEAQLRLPPAVSQPHTDSDDVPNDPLTCPYNYENPSIVESSSYLNRPESKLDFLRNPTWWMGTFLMAAGEVGNFAAFAFAPASLVAPLGAWSVVLSAILAHVFLGESVSNTNLIGIALCVTGAFLIGTSGPDISAVEAALDADAVFKLLIRLPFVIFLLLVLTATAALIYVSHRTTLGQRHIFVYVGVSSLLGAVTVVCAKALSTFLRMTIEGNSQFGNWLPFALGLILACAILAQLRYLNMAMAQFGNAQVIPVYYVLFTSCAMTSGVIMYREFDELTVRNLPFFIGICSTMTGVFFVSRSARQEILGEAPDNFDVLSNTSRKLKTSFNGRSMSTAERVKRVLAQQARYERVLPVSPMSSPRNSQYPAWS